MPEPRTILITGASSGIGAALATAYASPGVHLLLTGRNEARLAEVATRCTLKGATVITAVLDVTDSTAMANWLTAQDTLQPIDLAIANAGISGGTGMAGETAEQVREIFAINVAGVMNTLAPLVPLMKSRGRGQLAIISSLASFRGFPGAPAYCASKAAVRIYGEGLRTELLPFGVNLSVVCPGFIRTPMTDVNNFPMPFLWEVDRAALYICRKLAAKRARIAFPFGTYALVRLLAALPVGLVDRLLRFTPNKPPVKTGG